MLKSICGFDNFLLLQSDNKPMKTNTWHTHMFLAFKIKKLKKVYCLLYSIQF